jgi:rhomboid protease GluP
VTVAEEEALAVIPARTERQAMDWSLVLASQGIDVALDRAPQGFWRLLVAPADQPRAEQVIRLFRSENRGFDWHREVPGSEFLFDGRVAFWALAVALVYLAQDWLDRGVFDTRAVHSGEWWRAFTAEWMHRDLGHLASNLAMGAALLGLAMARYGAGLALLGSFLAGGLANYTGMWLRPEPYVGLGASGMIMGALGMIAAQTVPLWRTGRRGTRVVLASLGTSALVFILIGTSPSADVLAHTAGFIFGVGFGSLAALVPARRHRRANAFALAGAALLTAVTWGFALKR